MKYQDFVEQMLSEASKESFNTRLITSVCGLAGEAAECLSAAYTKDKILDECGDVLFYVSVAATALDISFESMVNHCHERLDVQLEVKKLSINCGNYADLVKKYLFHSKPLDIDKLIIILKEVIFNVKNIAQYYQYSLDQIIEKNIDKLNNRYKSGKFTVEEFLNKEAAKNE
jgi:NTP pyrophosphatase (non-canonical NTP hydrolase)